MIKEIKEGMETKRNKQNIDKELIGLKSNQTEFYK